MEHDLLSGVGGYKLTEDLGAEPTEDLFERTDDYYVYLKPQKLSDDDFRARNKRNDPGHE